jgi:nitrogen regulatory protein PII
MIGWEVKRSAPGVEPGDNMQQDDLSNAGSLRADPAPVLRTTRVVQIIALVKPFRAQAVLEALGSVAILGGTVREAMGYGRQKNRLHQYLGSEYNTSFVPKVELSVFVEESLAPAAIKAIVGPARTGRIGDGKILVVPCSGEFLSW